MSNKYKMPEIKPSRMTTQDISGFFDRMVNDKDFLIALLKDNNDKLRRVNEDLHRRYDNQIKKNYAMKKKTKLTIYDFLKKSKLRPADPKRFYKDFNEFIYQYDKYSYDE